MNELTIRSPLVASSSWRLPPVLMDYVGEVGQLEPRYDAHCEAYWEAEHKAYRERDNEAWRLQVAAALEVDEGEVYARFDDYLWSWQIVWEELGEEYVFCDHFFQVSSDLLFYDGANIGPCYLPSDVDWLRVHAALERLGHGACALALWEKLMAKFSHHELLVKHEQINEARAQKNSGHFVAAAWGVDASKVRYATSICSDKGRNGSFLVCFSGNQYYWNPVTKAIRVLFPYGPLEFDMNAPAGHKITWPYNLPLPLGIEIGKIARFLFCMGYDIEFLVNTGVTVTAHDKIEWAHQMRDAGFPLEAI